MEIPRPSDEKVRAGAQLQRTKGGRSQHGTYLLLRSFLACALSIYASAVDPSRLRSTHKN